MICIKQAIFLIVSLISTAMSASKDIKTQAAEIVEKSAGQSTVAEAGQKSAGQTTEIAGRPYAELRKLRFGRIPELGTSNLTFFEAWKKFQGKFSKDEALKKIIAEVTKAISESRRSVDVDAIQEDLLAFIASIKEQLSKTDISELETDIASSFGEYKELSKKINNEDMPLLYGLRIAGRPFIPDLKEALFAVEHKEVKIGELMLSMLKKLEQYQNTPRSIKVMIELTEPKKVNREATPDDLFDLTKETLTLMRRMDRTAGLPEKTKEKIKEAAVAIAQKVTKARKYS